MEITFEVANLPTSEVGVLRVNSSPVAVLLKTTLSLFSIWDMYEMFEYYQENRHTSTPANSGVVSLAMEMSALHGTVS